MNKANLILSPELRRSLGVKHNRRSSCLLTDAGVPPEHVPVEDVEGEVSEAPWDLTVEILPVERTEGEEVRLDWIWRLIEHVFTTNSVLQLKTKKETPPHAYSKAFLEVT